MSIYPNVSQQHLINLRKVAEDKKNQRALEIESRISKETHDTKLAGGFAPVTKHWDNIIETTRNLSEIVEKTNVEDGKAQAQAVIKYHRPPFSTWYIAIYGEKQKLPQIRRKRKRWCILE